MYSEASDSKHDKQFNQYYSNHQRMDVAKYISLFLLQHHHCRLGALGNLDIHRIPAANTGSELNGGYYRLEWHAAGDTDEELPLFIARQEDISTDEATSVVSAFISEAAKALQNGKALTLPGIGTFVMHRGQTSFHTDQAFSMSDGTIPLSYFKNKPNSADIAPEPTAAKGEEAEDTYPAADEEPTEQSGTSWLRIGLWALGILLVLSVVAGILRYTLWDEQTPETPPSANVRNEMPTDSVAATPAPMADSVAAPASDSLQRVDSTEEKLTVPTAAPGTFRFILNKYKRLDAAEKRAKKLTGYGHPVKVISMHDSLHYVVEELQIPASDTTRIKDSLTRWLSPGGVDIMK